MSKNAVRFFSDKNGDARLRGQDMGKAEASA